MNEDTEITALINALQDERYDWRTISGLCKDTGLMEQQVKFLLKKMSKRKDEYRIVSVPDYGKYEFLFTTVGHYKKTRPFSTKLLSALSGKII